MTTSVRWAVFSVMAVLAPAAAQAQITRVSGSDTRQSIGVNLGAFLPKGEDSRVDGDVLFRNGDSLLFDIKDFTGASVGAEYLVGVSRAHRGGSGRQLLSADSAEYLPRRR